MSWAFDFQPYFKLLVSPTRWTNAGRTNILTRIEYFQLTHMTALTNSMEQSPSWQANSHSASQVILSRLCNPKVHYRAQMGPSLVPNLSLIHTVHIPYRSLGRSKESVQVRDPV